MRVELVGCELCQVGEVLFFDGVESLTLRVVKVGEKLVGGCVNRVDKYLVFLYEFFIRDILETMPLIPKVALIVEKTGSQWLTVMTVNGPDLLAILQSILLRAIPH